MMLEIAGLNAYYGKSHILQGVDMHIDAGEVVSLLGRNGVGRSTTVKAIMGEWCRKDPSSSTAAISRDCRATASLVSGLVTFRSIATFSRA